MSDINEKETMQYFINGLQKARSAAKDLAILNQRSAWSQIIVGLDQMLSHAKTLFEGKAQTREETLMLAAAIQDDIENPAPPPLIIH